MYVSFVRYTCFSELVHLLEAERDCLVAVLRNEFIISNIISSVIKVVREESGKAASGGNEFCPQDSLNVRSYF